jgi:C-terminal processing protease CtpA/Prc
MEDNLKHIAEAIRDYYIDEEKALDAYNKIIEYIEKRHTDIYDIDIITYKINSILDVTTDDRHLFISPTRAVCRGGNQYFGVDRVTPYYVLIRSLPWLANPETAAFYQKIFSKFQDPLIIDLRDCPGGTAETAYFILSHMFDDGTPLYKVRKRNQPDVEFKAASNFDFYQHPLKVTKFKGQINVIVNKYTKSGAEQIAYILQQRKRAKIYGETTSGMAHATTTLTIGEFNVHIPNIEMLSVDSGTDWENKGVVPDYPVQSKEYISLIYDAVSKEQFSPA